MSSTVRRAQNTPAMDIRVDSLTFGVREPCDVYIFVNHKRFIIRVSPSPDFPDSVEARYTKRLDAAQEANDFAEQYRILVEIEQLVLITVNDTPQIKPGDISLPSYRSRILNVTVFRKDLPVFYPSEIIVIAKLRSTRILKVLVEGQLMCCKLAEARHPDLIQELQALQEILQFGLGPSIRIPRLRGFIRSEDESGLIGFLTNHIETDPSNVTIGSLRGRVHTIDKSRRYKWASQTEHVIKALREIKVIWGDAKADNLLIDSHDDVWLIDLGGGRTHGWVSEELQDSKEGDLQGLQLIREFLKLLLGVLTLSTKAEPQRERAPTFIRALRVRFLLNLEPWRLAMD
ncbi:MAG: hypothetical protein M1837_001344 [Sclerophora amabilis]|nr:MAG: hypothetical protein M1837_001344 [Sclerophora amabilis]